MTAPEAVRSAALAVGSLQLLANLTMLFRGPLRIRAELQGGALSERFADLLTIAWAYGGLANLCLSVLLILLAAPLRAGSALAWRVTALVGLYYVVAGLALYLLGLRRHPGLLVFVLFGLVLLIPLWAARARYGG